MHLPLLMWKTLSGFGTKLVKKRTFDGIHSCCFLMTKSDGIDFFYRF